MLPHISAISITTGTTV
ncbi:rCG47028, partial [Rattus norvegicus]